MTLQSIIDNAKRIAFFGGAGVSTESNIPDFRCEFCRKNASILTHHGNGR